MPFWIWLILGFVLLSFLGMFAATWPIAKKVYHNILVRTGPEKWTRANSYPPNPEHTRMFDLGMDWAHENEARKRPVSIENEGLKLAGEYFDFGHKRCAIIFPGRTESLYYSYYFAQPYAEAGCNILVVDSRAHGLSEGKYNYCSTREWSDVIAWSRFAHDRLGCSDVVLHGICVGGGAVVLAAAKPEFPAYVSHLVVEGLFATFLESFKLHMKAEKRPIFPVLYEILGRPAGIRHEDPRSAAHSRYRQGENADPVSPRPQGRLLAAEARRRAVRGLQCPEGARLDGRRLAFPPAHQQSGAV